MGVVYSPEEVASGHIARTGDHQRLGHYLLDAVKPRSPLLAGVVYGSTVTTPSIRSDVDVLFIYGDGRENEALSYIKDIKAQARNDGIYAKVEEHFEPEFPLIKPGQTDPQYLAHFRRVIASQSTWAVNNPLDYLCSTEPSEDELLRDVIGFVSGKRAKFAAAATDDEMDYRVLQRAFELPVAIARKVKQVMTARYGEDAPTEDKHHMRRIGSEVLASFIEDGVRYARLASELHLELSELDKAYTSVLQDSLRSKDVKGYDAYLRSSRTYTIETAFNLALYWQGVLEVL